MQLMVKSKADKSKSTIRVERETITPGIAQAYLDKNTRNRKSNAQAVASYARDMLNGNWHMTGAPIVFDRDGVLIDGQHRLMACVKADINFETMVVYGAAPESQDVIDTNRPRSAADALRISGQAWTAQKIAVARWILALKGGFVHPHDYGKAVKPTNTELVQCVMTREMLGSSIAKCQSATGTTISSVAFFHYMGTHAMGVPDTADAFASVFTTGIPGYDGCPAHLLRERLLRQRSSTEKFDTPTRHVAMIHAWNMFAAKETAAIFRVPNTARIRGLDPKKL